MKGVRAGDMIRGRYTGANDALRGKTALILMKGPASTTLTAQFDDMTLVINGVRMWSGWHTFPRRDFKLRINKHLPPHAHADDCVYD